ncbi:MAG: hypothetical protein COB54_03335 [Alphaproteobacteria bacterium]|nr:MAG: hypothetical protein COB54_03335 [Alphaproteobacteria bacterium]
MATTVVAVLPAILLSAQSFLAVAVHRSGLCLVLRTNRFYEDFDLINRSFRSVIFCIDIIARGIVRLYNSGDILGLI